MRVSKIGIVIVLTLTLIASFTAGYFVTKLYTKNNESQNETATAEAAKLLSVSDLINSKTQVVKKLTYTKNGTSFTRELNESATNEIIGMDKKSAENYFKEQGYILLEFSDKKVVISKDVDSWPPGSFVIKANGEVIGVYKVEESGNLRLIENSDIRLENLPEEDRREIELGKIFESIDEAYMLLEEYSS